jgi:hypothetical protein
VSQLKSDVISRQTNGHISASRPTWGSVTPSNYGLTGESLAMTETAGYSACISGTGGRIDTRISPADAELIIGCWHYFQTRIYSLRGIYGHSKTRIRVENGVAIRHLSVMHVNVAFLSQVIQSLHSCICHLFDGKRYFSANHEKFE